MKKQRRLFALLSVQILLLYDAGAFSRLTRNIAFCSVERHTSRKTPMNFKNVLPTYLCTDSSINFILESSVFQLPVAKNKLHLSSIQPILGPFIPKKPFFVGKKAVHLCGALIKKRKLFLLYFSNG